MYINGCQVGFYRGDVKLLMEDIGVLKPTVFPTVPRLLNRVYDKVSTWWPHRRENGEFGYQLFFCFLLFFFPDGENTGNLRKFKKTQGIWTTRGKVDYF